MPNDLIGVLALTTCLQNILRYKQMQQVHMLRSIAIGKPIAQAVRTEMLRCASVNVAEVHPVNPLVLKNPSPDSFSTLRHHPAGGVPDWGRLTEHSL